MRYLVTLDSTAGGQAENIPFSAAYILILNPTAKTLYVRVGGNDIPQTPANASIVCPPAYAMAWPVNGTAYGLGFGLPQLAIQPDGMPTAAIIYFFDASEPLPAFGPMPLDTLQAAITNTVAVDITNANINATITNSSLNANITNSTINAVGLLPDYAKITQPAGQTNGTFTGTIALPAGTRGVAVAVALPANMTALSLTGHQSGMVYLSGDPSLTPAMFGAFVTVPILSDDTALDYSMTISAAGFATFTLFGTSGILTPPQASDGPLLARVVPPTVSPAGSKASELSVPSGTAEWTMSTATTAAAGFASYVTSYACALTGVTTAQAAGARIAIYDGVSPAGSLRAVLARLQGQVGVHVQASGGCRVLLPVGWQIRGEVFNADGTAHTMMVSFTVEQETY